MTDQTHSTRLHRRVSTQDASAAVPEPYPRSAGAALQIPEFIRRLKQLCGALAGAAREREYLLAMTDRELRDIGITRVDAARLAKEPLWRRARDRLES